MQPSLVGQTTPVDSNKEVRYFCEHYVSESNVYVIISYMSHLADIFSSQPYWWGLGITQEPTRVKIADTRT